MPDLTDQQTINLALEHHRAGRLDQAEALYRQILAHQPAHADAMHYLGVVADQTGRHELAIELIHQSLAIRPDNADAYNNLASALINTGRLDEAIAACRRAISLKPALPEAFNNLGNALKEKGDLREAIANYDRALVLRPNYAEAHGNLGYALYLRGQLDEAIAVSRRAIELNPRFAEAHVNLGNALKDMGEIDQALALYRKAIALRPGYHQAHSNLVYAMHFHPGLDAGAIADEHRNWNRQYAQPLASAIQPHRNVPNPDRRLRIGYVSPDFREHAVAPMVLPLLECHDREKFEVFCYAQVQNSDAMTQRFRAQANQWRNTVGFSDEQIAALIRQDQIDILVDLAGHTQGNRLMTFARKPAPVQVTRQGYPNTTGMTAIDYRMTDAYADPPGFSDTLHSEQVIRLPQTNWIYQSPENCPPPEERPQSASVTFGCFNNFAKVTEPMLKLWAQILVSVPGSKLLLKARSLASHQVLRRVQRVFLAEKIPLDRVELMGQKHSARDHLALYHRIGIGLDPFPYHGTTTTCEALWMGVPVITLAGQTHVSRVGVSLLTSMDLPELIAESPEEYIRLAVALANDGPRLRNLHCTLRRRMQQSPLMDAPQFARNIEASYRQMWRRWCAAALTLR